MSPQTAQLIRRSPQRMCCRGATMAPRSVIQANHIAARNTTAKMERYKRGSHKSRAWSADYVPSKV